jgi:endonuclease/exonuclease/phosphatase family metal-dependent hydrolase
VHVRVFAVLLLFPSSPLNSQPAQTHLIRFQQPEPLSFEDLVTLASVDPPPPELQRRLGALRSEPFLSNEAAFEGVKPVRPVERGVGPVLRIAEWNINRLDKETMRDALSNLRAYQGAVRANPKAGRRLLRSASGEVRDLQGADIIVFDEIDDGVPRSGYQNVPRETAQLLHMNYVYAVEFVELNRLYLAVHKMDIVDPPAQVRMTAKFGVDANRYLGLEGTALLSRYPIISARIVDLPQEYDWYHGEAGAISGLVKAENWSAEKLFEERMTRQVRRGGRIMLVVQLAVPGVPTGTLTVLCPHLEDYARPAGRREQMDFVLKQAGSISGPVMSAGDLNTLGHDGAPATAKRLVRGYLLNPKFWLREAFYFVAPVPGLSYIFFAVNYLKNFHDPTAPSIPLLLPNHSKPIFSDIQHFRFQDGATFNWEGRKRDSYHHKGRTLSDSNERSWKGFRPTFSFRRTYHGTIGEFKIDWMFVKQLDGLQPRRGKTLCELNTAVGDRISDHCPITVEVPLRER